MGVVWLNSLEVLVLSFEYFACGAGELDGEGSDPEASSGFRWVLA